MIFFPDIMGSVSEKPGKRFYQNVATFEKCYHGRCAPTNLTNYCWSLTRQISKYK